MNVHKYRIFVYLERKNKTKQKKVIILGRQKCAMKKDLENVNCFLRSPKNITLDLVSAIFLQ